MWHGRRCNSAAHTLNPTVLLPACVEGPFDIELFSSLFFFSEKNLFSIGNVDILSKNIWMPKCTGEKIQCFQFGYGTTVLNAIFHLIVSCPILHYGSGSLADHNFHVGARSSHVMMNHFPFLKEETMVWHGRCNSVTEPNFRGEWKHEANKWRSHELPQEHFHIFPKSFGSQIFAEKSRFAAKKKTVFLLALLLLFSHPKEKYSWWTIRDLKYRRLGKWCLSRSLPSVSKQTI